MSYLPWHASAWNALIGNKARLPHALLIKGGKGIGKLAFARALAQALLCEAPLGDGAACGACNACRWLAADGHPDCRLLEPESGDHDDDAEEEKKPKDSKYITVDQVRALADFINLSSHRNGAKVVVLQPAETLNANAANALLKMLEEPPPHTYFILVSHRPRRLLPTILSRCRQITLAPPGRAEAEQWLRQQGIAEPQLALAQAGYAPLAALELHQGDFWEERRKLLQQLGQARFDALELADSFKAEDIPQLLLWLQQWTYDLIFFKFTGKIRYHADCAVALAHWASRLDAAALLRYHRELLRQQRIVQHPLNPRLFVEQLLLSYSNIRQS